MDARQARSMAIAVLLHAGFYKLFLWVPGIAPRLRQVLYYPNTGGSAHQRDYELYNMVVPAYLGVLLAL